MNGISTQRFCCCCFCCWLLLLLMVMMVPLSCTDTVNIEAMKYQHGLGWVSYGKLFVFFHRFSSIYFSSENSITCEHIWLSCSCLCAIWFTRNHCWGLFACCFFFFYLPRSGISFNCCGSRAPHTHITFSRVNSFSNELPATGNRFGKFLCSQSMILKTPPCFCCWMSCQWIMQMSRKQTWRHLLSVCALHDDGMLPSDRIAGLDSFWRKMRLLFSDFEGTWQSNGEHYRWNACGSLSANARGMSLLDAGTNSSASIKQKQGKSMLIPFR